MSGMGDLRRWIEDPFFVFFRKENHQNQKKFPRLRRGGGEGPCTPWRKDGAGRRGFWLQTLWRYRFLTAVFRLSQIQADAGLLGLGGAMPGLSAWRRGCYGGAEVSPETQNGVPGRHRYSDAQL